MGLEQTASARCFGGMQNVYTHTSTTTGTDMAFSVYLPEAAAYGPCPVVWYLSGLTCTWENVTTKGQFQRAANEMGLIIVCPDTSPRGLDLPGEHDSYDFGSGAGFYVDATEAPFADNYRMYSYITQELPALIAAEFPADMQRQGIFGHSMGGHGALTIALKNSETFRSVSAFAPICSPLNCPWGDKALTGYIGSDQAAWRAYDTTALIEDGRTVPEMLIDQGTADNFLAEQLKPELLANACIKAGIPLTLRMQPGYDHSYYFIASFMEEHLAWHADRLFA